MNSLLHEIAAADRDLVLPATPEHERSLRLLEWARVTALVARHCRNGLAAMRVRARRPYVDTAPILLRHLLAAELRPESERDVWPPLCDVTEAVALLERDRPRRLDGGELIHLACIAAELDRLRVHFLAREAVSPRWCDGARQLAGQEGMTATIGRYLDRDGCVRADATPELSRLRRVIRDGERGVRAEVARAMAAARERNALTAPEPTLRGERFCLPVRAGAKSLVDGIVHDRSASGGTLFIEPAAVVQRQNELAERRLDAAAEEERIVLELNSLVEANAADLALSCDFALRVDEICAALRWSFAVDGAVVVPAAGARLDLRRARHPLLLSRATADEQGCVPLDLRLPGETHVLLVSGPNAGGKSVALKCVGLMVLLAQSGWDLPVRADSTLPLMSKVFVDLGDDQSIALSLSSFSAHLGHLAGFLAAADAHTLILCDEIGSGTDPEEGSALAYTVLEELADRGATIVASTHYSLLKAAVGDHPEMTNAAMEFDERSLRPLFNLRLGVPGASHAFDIAARLDFPGDLLERARKRVGEARFQIERLLVELGARARRLREAERAARLDADAATHTRRELTRRLAGIDQERADLLEAARGEAERFLAEARRTLERVVRELRVGGADGKAIRYGRDALTRLRERLPGGGAESPPATEPACGDWVRVPHLGLTGRVAEIRGGRITVNAAGMRLTLTPELVESAPEADDNRETAGTGDWRWSTAGAPAVHEIDLRGVRAEEGWEALDRLIDRAIPAGINEIGVIHGFGTGRLRAHLHERLAADARVASFATAPADQGGEGRTIVMLA
ncbi:Smr/MutS family protein [bacterium]|nr:Smr/MutS family protein [bacterium]MBU1674862.1 Smr/MutS family protein [bacterium]